MVVLKSGKHIFGAKLTAAEKKALDMEARRSLAEYTRKHELEIEATVIWQIKRVLEEELGEEVDVSLLKRLYEGLDVELNKLIDHYEMDDDDAQWLCTKKLKDEGIDIEAWRREKYPNLKYEINCK
jgi:hypothetical protein